MGLWNCNESAVSVPALSRHGWRAGVWGSWTLMGARRLRQDLPRELTNYNGNLEIARALRYDQRLAMSRSHV
jgi:hypothetical protein